MALWSSGWCLPTRDEIVAEPMGKRWDVGGGYEMLDGGDLLHAQFG